MARAILDTLILLLLLIPAMIGVVMLKRIFQGRPAFTGADWRFLFGRPKQEVFTARFWVKVGLAAVACFFIGLTEYFILIPYGFDWYIGALLVTALGIVVLAPKYLG